MGFFKRILLKIQRGFAKAPRLFLILAALILFTIWGVFVSQSESKQKVAKRQNVERSGPITEGPSESKVGESKEKSNLSSPPIKAVHTDLKPPSEAVETAGQVWWLLNVPYDVEKETDLIAKEMLASLIEPVAYEDAISTFQAPMEGDPWDRIEVIVSDQMEKDLWLFYVVGMTKDVEQAGAFIQIEKKEGGRWQAREIIDQ